MYCKKFYFLFVVCTLFIARDFYAQDDSAKERDLAEGLVKSADVLNFQFKDYALEYAEYISPAVGTKDEKPALLLYLHGKGAQANGRMLVEAHFDVLLEYVRKHEIPLVIVAPIMKKDQDYWWGGDYLGIIGLLLDAKREEYNIDPQKNYVTGLSMGGGGTFSMVSAHPETFAAAVPLCGWGDITKADKLLSTPMWVFHGAKDDVVPPVNSRGIVEAVQALGGEKMKYTELPEGRHNIWDDVYMNEDVWKWMFAQVREQRENEFPVTRGVVQRVLDDYELGNVHEWEWIYFTPLNSARNLISTTPGHEWQDEDDLSGRIAFAWNTTGLFVMVSVKDNEIVTAPEEKDIWSRDSIEIFIDTRKEPDLMREKWGEGCYQLIIRPPSKENPMSVMTFNKNVDTSKIAHVGKITPNGYILEVMIPWEVIGCSDMQNGRELGLQFFLNDYDSRDGDAVQPRTMSFDGRQGITSNPSGMIKAKLTTSLTNSDDSLDSMLLFHHDGLLPDDDPDSIFDFVIDGTLFRRISAVQYGIIPSGKEAAGEYTVSVKEDIFTQYDESYQCDIEVSTLKMDSIPKSGTAVIIFYDTEGKDVGRVYRPYLFGRNIEDEIAKLDRILASQDPKKLLLENSPLLKTYLSIMSAKIYLKEALEKEDYGWAKAILSEITKINPEKYFAVPAAE